MQTIAIPTTLYAVNGAVNGSPAKEEQDDDGEASCLPPGRLPEVKRIFLISDATGVMSRSILLKSLAQFDTCADEKAPYATKANGTSADDDEEEDYASTAGTCDVRTRTFTFVRTPMALSQILKKAKERGACVMYTIAKSELRDFARDECRKLNLLHVDLIGT